jgi:hypothetical protein
MTVTEAMVGAPNRVHGGIMMAFLDEGLGLVTAHHGVDAMTASLTVDLRAPAYVGATLTQRAWLARREGRKWLLVHPAAIRVVPARRLIGASGDSPAIRETRPAAVSRPRSEPKRDDAKAMLIDELETLSGCRWVRAGPVRAGEVGRAGRGVVLA